MNPVFGRKIPLNRDHEVKYALRNLAIVSPEVVEIKFPYPRYTKTFYNQGNDGACVGFSTSIMTSIYNRKRYYAKWLWQRAKVYDNDPTTSEGDANGTYVFAAFDALRKEGHCQYRNNTIKPVNISHGIKSFYWIKSVDEMRIAFALGRPVVLGINWYSSFMNYTEKIYKGKKEYWIGTSSDLGYVMGGHATLTFWLSDKREAGKLVGTWGDKYPDVWVPYNTINRLINEDGEACAAIDL